MVPVGETSWSRCNRRAESPPFIVGRGTGPRHRPRTRLCRLGSPDPDLFVIRRAQTTEEKTHIGTLEIAGDRPPRYGEKTPSPHRRARACPSPCLGLPNDRGGQAPALREKTPPHRRARACPSLSSAYSNDRGGQAPALRENRDLNLLNTEPHLIFLPYLIGDRRACGADIRFQLRNVQIADVITVDAVFA